MRGVRIAAELVASCVVCASWVVKGVRRTASRIIDKAQG
jgi:hypothetical protein